MQASAGLVAPVALQQLSDIHQCPLSRSPSAIAEAAHAVLRQCSLSSPALTMIDTAQAAPLQFSLSRSASTTITDAAQAAPLQCSLPSLASRLTEAAAQGAPLAEHVRTAWAMLLGADAPAAMISGNSALPGGGVLDERCYGPPAVFDHYRQQPQPPLPLPLPQQQLFCGFREQPALLTNYQSTGSRVTVAVIPYIATSAYQAANFEGRKGSFTAPSAMVDTCSPGMPRWQLQGPTSQQLPCSCSAASAGVPKPVDSGPPCALPTSLVAPGVNPAAAHPWGEHQQPPQPPPGSCSAGAVLPVWQQLPTLSCALPFGGLGRDAAQSTVWAASADNFLLSRQGVLSAAGHHQSGALAGLLASEPSSCLDNPSASVLAFLLGSTNAAWCP